MLEEADRANPMLIKNFYSSFEELLRSSGFVPSEFVQDVDGLSDYSENQLIYAGTEAIKIQLEFLISQMREMDPNNYKERLLGLIDKTKITQHLKEDLINRIKLGK